MRVQRYNVSCCFHDCKERRTLAGNNPPMSHVLLCQYHSNEDAFGFSGGSLVAAE